MKLIQCVIAASALLFVGADGPEDLVKAELAKFQGVWMPESIQIGSKKTPDESLKNFRLVIEGDVWTLTTAGKRVSKIKLDPSKSPRHLDLIDDVNGMPRVLRCLYEFKDESLTICRPYMQLDAPRPEKIKPDGEFIGVAVWKREKK